MNSIHVYFFFTIEIVAGVTQMYEIGLFSLRTIDLNRSTVFLKYLTNPYKFRLNANFNVFSL
jgi:hypothetical protein